MIKENNNYAAVVIKALIASGFNDEIKAGKSAPYMANPPVLSAEGIHKKLTQSNLKKTNFDANESAKYALSILKPFVSAIS